MCPVPYHLKLGLLRGAALRRAAALCCAAPRLTTPCLATQRGAVQRRAARRGAAWLGAAWRAWSNVDVCVPAESAGMQRFPGGGARHVGTDEVVVVNTTDRI
eukprot:gene10909-biopygen18344